tara:strand:- start:2607 stop:3071 length:465 start_codon:yes stop_codon:yes gene_type:complete
MLAELIMVGMLLSPTPEVECLAKNMYYEARSEGIAGMLAVTNVVINRVEDERFPGTICEVIEQGPTIELGTDVKFPVKNRCQFSWYCDGKSDEPIDLEMYAATRGLAHQVLRKAFPYLDLTGGALFYHAQYIKPKWSSKFQLTLILNKHMFYKW